MERNTNVFLSPTPGGKPDSLGGTLVGTGTSRTEGRSATPPRFRAGPGWDASSALTLGVGSRLRNSLESGLSTPGGPSAASPGAGSTMRSMSSGGSRQPLRPGVENMMLQATKRQMDAVEEKFSSQLARAMANSDRVREAAIQRLEDKVNMTQGLHQPRLDRRVAELVGNFKGLSEEMQQMIRRIDNMDSRNREWRSHVEDELMGRHTELEQMIQKASSKANVAQASIEDVQSRLSTRMQRLELEMSERAAHFEETGDALNLLHGRCEALEANAGSWPNRSKEILVHSARGEVPDLSNQIGDVKTMVDRQLAEMHDVQIRTETQEQGVQILRTRVEGIDEKFRRLAERVTTSDWEGRFETMKLHLHEEARIKSEHVEQLDVISKRLEMQEQAYEEMRQLHGHIMQVSSQVSGEATPGYQVGGSWHVCDATSSSPVDREASRGLDLNVGVVAGDALDVRPDACGLGNRVAALEETLRTHQAEYRVYAANAVEFQNECRESVGKLQTQSLLASVRQGLDERDRSTNVRRWDRGLRDVTAEPDFSLDPPDVPVQSYGLASFSDE
uniref:Uncharacterized protein n=1 Tax=Noctiluca scintillans TaxID=2966 RepID=A0A7S0ZS86_NOCSC|mmetsp:Transcript_16847/g.45614  ORF Transcript_16847/g.45614 Transcript_16847/m.45614 type:complete len:561 (+) Transcript_16847:53-1735(+)